MINEKDYYTPPTQAIFDDIKQASIKLWNTYDNTYGYVDEKVNSIKDIQNVSDNYAFMIAMFDWENQIKVQKYLKLKASKTLVQRLIDINREY